MSQTTSPTSGSGAVPGPSLFRKLARRWELRPRPLIARRALKRLLENPDDTEQVFVLLRAKGGRNLERLYRRVRRDPVGRRILEEQRDLIPVLSDSETLLALPEATLGHQYARFVGTEQISAQGLADVSMGSRGDDDLDPDASPELMSFGARLRDMHDLWHVVTGYSRDVLGELALLAFTYEQTRNEGIGYIVKNVERRMRKGGNTEISEFLRKAIDRGRNAVLLPAADWEALLRLPLEEVRAQLQVGAPVQYEQQRTADGEAAAAATTA